MNKRRATLHRWGRHILDIFVPPLCLLCHAPVSEAGLLCGHCLPTLTFISDPCCALCSLPTHGQEHVSPRQRTFICSACQEDPLPWQGARSALLYDAGAKSLILPLKYGDKTEFASFLGRLIAQAADTMLGGVDYIVPIPLHSSRLRQRYYNQSVLIGRALSRLKGVPLMVDGLKRIVPTPVLEGKGRYERMRILHQSMIVSSGRESSLKWKNIALLDDVMTTGATARAASMALKKIGVKNIYVLSAARVPKGEHDHDEGFGRILLSDHEE